MQLPWSRGGRGSSRITGLLEAVEYCPLAPDGPKFITSTQMIREETRTSNAQHSSYSLLDRCDSVLIFWGRGGGGGWSTCSLSSCKAVVLFGAIDHMVLLWVI